MIILYLIVSLASLVVLLAVVTFILIQILAAFTTDAPFVSVPSHMEEEIIKALELNNNSKLYDLGCGDARILLKAVQQYPKIKAVGVDMAFFPYLLAKFYTRRFKNIKIQRDNIFSTDISEATHVFLYLFPEVVTKLMPILKGQCKLGTRIVSCDFECTDQKPSEVILIKDSGQKRGKKLFVYVV